MLATAALAAEPPRLVSATFFGGIGDDQIEGVAIAPDGTIYAAGTMGWPVEELPGGVKPVTFGAPSDVQSRYGCGFVARFSSDGRKLLAYAQLALGLGKLTSVAVNETGVYLGGYVNEAAEPLIADLGGILTKARTDPRTGPLYSVPYGVERHAWATVDQRGVPCVLRLPADLSKIECGTFLEGWQSTWFEWDVREDFWQPVALGLLSNGDLVVAHDGGYVRDPEPGQRPTEKDFLYTPDYVSRLSPDLKRRMWKKDIYTPPVDREKASQHIQGGWSHDALGNTRTLCLRVGSRDNFYISGCSLTRTSKEGWRSPFLWKLGPDGEIIWTAYTFDPMSGPEDRLGGLVAGATVQSVAEDERGNLAVALVGNGEPAQSVLDRHPRDYARPAPRLKGATRLAPAERSNPWWGIVARLGGQSPELLGGEFVAAQLGGERKAVYLMDVCALPGGRILAIGRHTEGFTVTSDAWYRDRVRGGFLRVVSQDFNEGFSTSVPDVDLAAAARRGSRCAIVGMARSPRAPVKDPLFPRPAGRDGYLMVVDCP